MKRSDTHQPAKDGAFEIVPSGELAPVPAPKTTALSFLAGSEETPLHNLFHRRGMLASAQAVGWFVLAGTELIRLKKQLPHGKWQEWLTTNCEFNARTAQRYMALAEGVKNKFLRDAAKSTAEEFVRLLEKSAGTLSDTEQRTLLNCVQKLTDGSTLSQLYLELGICKTPQGAKTRGGKTSAPADTDPNAAVEVARDLLAIPLTKIDEHWDEHWMHLPFDTMQEIDGILLRWRESLKKSLKGGERI